MLTIFFYFYFFFVAAFNVIGTPGNILQVSLPASTPLYARRRSLLGALASPISSGSEETDSQSNFSLIATIHIAKNVVSRLLAGQFPLVYQKFTSTQPVSILLQSSFSSTSPLASSQAHPSLAVISLDGRIDWTLTSAASIFAYSPLSSSMFFVPSYRNKSTTVTGRGIVAITPKTNFFNSPSVSSSSSGSQIFKVVLAENESLLVEKRTLLGYSLDTQDVQKFKYPSLESLPSSINALDNISNSVSESFQTETQSQQQQQQKPSGSIFSRILEPIKSTTQKVASFSNGLWKQRTSSSSSTGSYLRVHGPSTILLTSSPSNSVVGLWGFLISSTSYLIKGTIYLLRTILLIFKNFINTLISTPSSSSSSTTSINNNNYDYNLISTNLNSLESQTAKLLLNELRIQKSEKLRKISGLAPSHPKDYLKIATIGPDGKATIKSTDSFREFLK